LNLNVHFHTVFLDGVFVRDPDGRVAFHAAREPEAAELAAIVRRVHRRATAWLVRHRYVDGRTAEERTNEPAESSAMEACGTVAAARYVHQARGRRSPRGGDRDGAARLRLVGEHEGFNLHAGVRVAAGDDLGRERLCR
jgi:hypothetical protein